MPHFECILRNGKQCKQGNEKKQHQDALVMRVFAQGTHIGICKLQFKILWD